MTDIQAYDNSFIEHANIVADIADELAEHIAPEEIIAAVLPDLVIGPAPEWNYNGDS